MEATSIVCIADKNGNIIRSFQFWSDSYARYEQLMSQYLAPFVKRENEYKFFITTDFIKDGYNGK